MMCIKVNESILLYPRGTKREKERKRWLMDVAYTFQGPLWLLKPLNVTEFPTKSVFGIFTSFLSSPLMIIYNRKNDQ